MTIFHRLQGTLVRNFNVSEQLYYKLLYKSSIYMGLAKILVARDGTGLYFLKIPVNFLQYCGTVGLLNSSRSIVNRSKVNNFITSNYKSNTYIACSLIFVNKIFLFLTLLSVLIFLKDSVSKTTGSSLL